MGIYSTNRTSLGKYSGEDIYPDESYFFVNGCLECMIDIEINNGYMFEKTIMSDFEEAKLLHEGYEILYEGTFETAFNKIKSFVKSVWGKIKGIFSTFLKKLDSVIIRDNKEFLNKYRKEVRMKDLSKMKYKIQKKDKSKMSELQDILKGDKFEEEFSEIVSAIKNFNNKNSYAYKVKDMISDGEYVDHLIDKIFPNLKTDDKDFIKDFHEYIYDTEESEEGLKKELLTEIERDLLGDNIKKEVTQSQKEMNKFFSDMLKKIDKAENQILNIKGEDDEKFTFDLEFENNYPMNNNIIIISEDRYADKTQKHIQTQIKKINIKNTIDAESEREYNRWDEYDKQKAAEKQKIKDNYDDYMNKNKQNVNSGRIKYGLTNKKARDILLPLISSLGTATTNMQTLYTKSVTCFLNEHKFGIKQSRRIFSKAVAYNDKKARNEAMELYLDAVEEAAEYEISSLFEDYSI